MAPAFVLARAGYDVWLGNNRGCRYSNTHTTLSNKDFDYWQFTWEEMGTKDTPAVIDYILETTGYDKINYLGHSEGTTQIMAGGSLMPDYYNSKFNVCIFYAPPASLHKNPDVILQTAARPLILKAITGFLDLIGEYSLVPYTKKVGEKTVCRFFDAYICNLVMHWFIDLDPTIDYSKRYDMYMSNLPSGAGYLDFAHYAQNM